MLTATDENKILWYGYTSWYNYMIFMSEYKKNF